MENAGENIEIPKIVVDFVDSDNEENKGSIGKENTGNGQPEDVVDCKTATDDVDMSSVSSKLEKLIADKGDSAARVSEFGSQENFYLNLDVGSADSGLWFKGHTPLPSDSEDEEELRGQCDKIFSYEHEYALPTSSDPIPEKERSKLVKNDCSFNEKDFSRHRNSSKALAGLAPAILNKHKRHHKHKSKHSRSKEKSLEKLNNDENQAPVFFQAGQLPVNDTPNRTRAKTISVLHSINEVKEIDPLDASNRSRSTSLIDKVDSVPTTLDISKTDLKQNHRHRKHNHARHRKNKGLNAQDNLEIRIKSGLQKLEEERKAYQGVLAEIEEGIGQKDIEDITSHRFGNFQNIRRISQKKRYIKSGMMTHLTHSDVDSVHSFKPHMHIDMEDDQIELAPKELTLRLDNRENKGFVELEELITNENNELQWKERARWIKFEEDVEKNERWGKPHVASLSFQSLLELRRGIETGSVLLSLDNHDLPTIFESVVDNMISTDQITTSVKDQIIAILLSKHCHHHQNKTTGSFRQRAFSISSQNSFIKMEADKTEGALEQLEMGTEPNGDFEIAENINLTSRIEEHRTVSFLDLERQAEMESKKKSEETNGVVTGRHKSNSVRFAPEDADDYLKTESDVKEKIPIGAEATSVLVGTLAELERPAMAFVRLSQGRFLGNLTEVTIPIRFMFIILGPPDSHDYYEIGRSVATLMSDKIFHDLAYAAKSREDLLAAINSFLDDSIVLAPGDWDRHLLLPLLQAEISEKRRERIKLLKEKAQLDHTPDEKPFLRTGKCFGGLKRDLERKSKFYVSDIKDAFNWRCVVTVIFCFFATLAPTIAFGALLSKKTDNSLGVLETIMATSLCGAIFSLTAGQPLMIVGTTGPILVFEQATYTLCDFFQIEFLVWRCWIGFFVMLILFLIVAFELSYLVEYFTRFTEEVFSVLISILFIYECGSFLVQTFKNYPLKRPTSSSGVGGGYSMNGSQSNMTTPIQDLPTYSIEQLKYIDQSCHENANVALISLLIVIGTFTIAYWLRKLRCSHFFTSRARRVLSDFGVPIAMIMMVVLNNISHDIDVKKIKIPKDFTPTLPSRKRFIVNPIENIDIIYILVALPVAGCVSILLFMETELTGVLLNKRKNKLKKGGGYNLDLFMMGILTGLCSILGLPWMCAATVRSVQHQNALAIMSRSHAPGERPYLMHIKEQRLTNFFIHALIGCCCFASSILELVPLAVCFGVFAYLGVSSLAGIQFIEQIRLIFVPMKYHPNKKYVRCVKFRSLVSYTLIQVFCLLLLIGAKLSPAAPLFPFVLICMAFLRRFIERYYSEEELEDLDNEDDDDEFEDDEYCIGLPM